MSEPKTDRYVTLGDIAAELRIMKAEGMTRGAVLYAVDKVFWEQDTAALALILRGTK